MIKAKIVADSVGPANVRLTTFELTYPRFIHAELMTHRTFSRNAASSRAIPVKKQMERIRRQPAIPETWGLNQPGMQSTIEATGFRRALGRFLWVLCGRVVLVFSWLLLKLNFHKQIVNRMAEPWSHITVILTGDEFGFANFFAQRDHHAAEPNFQVLARKMWVAYNLQTPKRLRFGEWHLPYIHTWDQMEVETKWNCTHEEAIEYLKKISVGRCARVSYLNHDGERHLKDDIGLAEKLTGSNPGHWSPLEHVCKAAPLPAGSGNIRGWIQYRKEFDQENVLAFKQWEPNDYKLEIGDFLVDLRKSES